MEDVTAAMATSVAPPPESPAAAQLIAWHDVFRAAQVGAAFAFTVAAAFHVSGCSHALSDCATAMRKQKN